MLKKQPTFLEKIEEIKSDFNETINCLYDDFNSDPDINDEKINYIMGKFIYSEFSTNEESFFWDYISYKVYIRYFEMKKEWFFIEYPDATINDFYAEEIKEIEENTISDTTPNIYFDCFCLNEILEPNILEEINNSQNRKLEFVKALQGNTINWHPKIFSTRHDFELFEMLQPKVKDILADYSYFYRRMFKENKIHAKPTPFAEWLNDTYEIADLKPKVKTLIQCETQAKKDIYETTKILYKTQNNH